MSNHTHQGRHVVQRQRHWGPRDAWLLARLRPTRSAVRRRSGDLAELRVGRRVGRRSPTEPHVGRRPPTEPHVGRRPPTEPHVGRRSPDRARRTTAGPKSAPPRQLRLSETVAFPSLYLPSARLALLLLIPPDGQRPPPLGEGLGEGLPTEPFRWQEPIYRAPNPRARYKPAPGTAWYYPLGEGLPTEPFRCPRES